MTYKNRRRLDVFLLALVGGAAAVIAIIGGIIGDSERITAYWASAELGDDGPARITEVIDYDFGYESRHGMFREVDDLDPDAVVEVSSPTAPDQTLVTGYPGGATIRIGDPDRTITGRHRYRIDYPVDIGGGPGPGRMVAWDAVGSRWQVDMSSVEIHLTAATQFSDLQCSIGSDGTWGGCTVTQPEPGHLVATFDGIDAGDGVTISARTGAALAAAPATPTPPSGPTDDPGSGLALPALLAAGTALVAAAVASRRVRLAGRELVWGGGAADAAYGPQLGQDLPVRVVDHDELANLASTEFTPPRGLSAWQGGIIHREGVEADHKVAWLLEQAIDGSIDLDGEDPVSLLRRSAVDDPEDEDALHGIFGGRSSVTLGEYDKQFAAGWEHVGKRLERWHERAPYWDPAGEERRGSAVVIGVVAMVVGLLASIIGAALANRLGLPWLVVLALGALALGAGWAMALRSWELSVRTPEGSGLWILTESFRRFVERSEARHVEEAARAGRLREYTAWATALGEADHWARVVDQADLDPEHIEPTGLYLAALAPALSSATTSAATAPSSGGSGFSGGSVGGGGGGGGGGSW